MDIDAPRRDFTKTDAGRYLVSFLMMRIAIGVLGIALPVVLVVVDVTVFHNGAHGSLSAYYYSGVRDVFVGMLCAIAIFLVCYKVATRGRENLAATVAGVAVLGVALLPTHRPSGSLAATTPLQDWLTESNTATVHYICAFVFISLLAVLSYYFGLREGKRPPRSNARSPRFWRSFHIGCAVVIGIAVVYMFVTTRFDVWDDYSLLIGETVAVWAFGVSWLMKGFELNVFRDLRTRPAGPPEPGRP